MFSREIIHIFYKTSNDKTLTFDFGSGKLHTGSGTAQYLKFTSTGQSATIVLLHSTDLIWGIINSGAVIE